MHKPGERAGPGIAGTRPDIVALGEASALLDVTTMDAGFADRDVEATATRQGSRYRCANGEPPNLDPIVAARVD